MVKVCISMIIIALNHESMAPLRWPLSHLVDTRNHGKPK